MSNDKTADIMDKIAKLLELANHPGTGEAEASNAAAMAQKLLQKYNLTLAEIAAATGQQAAPIVMATVPWYKGRTAGANRLALAVGRGYFCTVLVNRSQAHFAGREHDVAIASYVFEQLDRRLYQLALEAYKAYAVRFLADNGFSMREWYGGRYQTKRLDYIHSFVTGAAWALYARLYHSQKDFVASTALVVTADAAIKEFTDKNSSGKTYTPKHNRATIQAAYQAGAVAGKNIVIQKGLTTGAAQPPLGGE